MSDLGRKNPTEPMASRPASAGDTDTDTELRVERSDMATDDSVSTDDSRRLGGTARDRDSDRSNPVEAVKDPDNRAKLLLGTAALTLLNTILLIALLAGALGDGTGEQVVVDDVPCIVADADGEQSLYCQR